VSVLLFLRFDDSKPNRSFTAYFLSLSAFILALLAKTQIVFLPVAMLLCLGWPDSLPTKQVPTGNRAHSKFVQRILEMTPFLVVALVLGLVSVRFQIRGLGE